MTEPLVIHVVNAASSRGDLWAEVKRQNALIHELREAVHAHAQTIRDKQAVIDASTEKVARLEAPVSNGEWDKACTTALLEGCVESDEFAYRDDINAIIAARAKEPKP